MSELRKRGHVGSRNLYHKAGFRVHFFNHMNGSNFDIESSCMSLRAQDNMEATKRACSPNKQAEISV